VPTFTTWVPSELITRLEEGLKGLSRSLAPSVDAVAAWHPRYLVWSNLPGVRRRSLGEAGAARGRAAAVIAAIVGGTLGLSSEAVAQPPAPFGHSCTAQNGVRFCPTTSRAKRVHTFDGILLDVDVTLPPTGNGPFPTIVMLHGWGGSKVDFESTSPVGGYNNNFFARHGYAVLTYTARGFGDSCGGASPPDHSGACGKGYVHLADTRFEARDTQYLLGKLADQGITKPRAIGATGISYGGGQSMELAFLRNHIRLKNGKLAPWRSPQGKHLRIAAAYPRWPWSDLIDALLPNGRFLDTTVAPLGQSLHPIGVPIKSYIGGLYALGSVTGYYCGTAPASTPCQDRDANLPMDFAEVQAGQPLSADARAAIRGIYNHSTAYSLAFLQGASKPAPLLIQNGWTDDLFPPEHALRPYNLLRSRFANFPVSLQFGDLGHSRGSNKAATNKYFFNQARGFFRARLKHQGGSPAPGSVTAFNQTCPSSTPDGGPFRARSWPAIHNGHLAFGSSLSQTFTSAGGDQNVAAQFDPIGGTSDACKTVSTTNEPNTASYKRHLKDGFTMLGLPTVRANIQTTGQLGEIAARLWDLTPNGQQRLISRGVYSLRNNQTGKIVFQLHGNGYHFPKGHTVELQLLGRDQPYYQASNGVFSVEVTKLSVALPRLAK
jgi:predicted acyl esterase